MCGIFGNISDADIERTIRHLPHLCRPDAVAVWTRHTGPPDATPAIRDWFSDAGFDELAFEGPTDLNFRVGSNRLRVPPPPFEAGVPLFTFVR